MPSILPTKQVEKRKHHTDLELIEILSHDLEKKDFYMHQQSKMQELFTNMHLLSKYLL